MGDLHRIPVLLRFTTTPRQWRLEKGFLRAELGSFGRPRPQLDPWEVREEFLNLERTPGKLLKFLKKTGAFNVVSPADVRTYWSYQDGLRTMRRAGAEGWRNILARSTNRFIAELPKLKLLSGFDVKYFRGLPQATVDVNATLHAILASILFDFIQGSTFVPCAREDCPNDFKAKRGKQYCKQYCAHLASLRRRRGTPPNQPDLSRSYR